jgi:hypothetical protein
MPTPTETMRRFSAWVGAVSTHLEKERDRLKDFRNPHPDWAAARAIDREVLKFQDLLHALNPLTDSPATKHILGFYAPHYAKTLDMDGDGADGQDAVQDLGYMLDGHREPPSAA